MAEETNRASTHELWMKLLESTTAEAFLSDSDVQLPAFSDYIRELCRSKNEKPEQIIRRADIESSFGHRIFAGGRNPSRDTVLQMAFGFEMGPEEAQQLLKVARHTALHPKVRRDAVIVWCLHNKKTLVETQHVLDDNGMPLLGGGRNV